jgi:hypothetical protein
VIFAVSNCQIPKYWELTNYLYFYAMKSAILLTNKKDNSNILQINLKSLSKYPNEVEELIDVIVAESRKGEKDISFETVKKNLKKSGKL